MHRTGKRDGWPRGAWAVVCGVLAVGVGPLAAPAGPALMPGIVRQVDISSSETALDPARPLPLLNVDEELSGYLVQAERLVEQGKFDEAIQILQALVQRPDSGFHPAGERRFVSMRLKANELIGRMGPKGRRLYRSLYDPQAQQLYAEAMASSSPARLLRQVSERYLHTSYGPRSLEALGAIYFDRARFAQAASCWRQLLALAPAGNRRATILAKLAAAHHLAGEATPTQQAAETLAKSFPDASGVLGGRKVRLVDFVNRVRKRAVPSRGGRFVARAGWPGLGGVPDGLSAMSECDVVLSPRWRYTDVPLSAGENVLQKLTAGQKMYLSAWKHQIYSSSSRSYRRTVRLQNGHLYLRTISSSRSAAESVLPGMLHPVVVGNTVIARLDDRVVGYDLLTGNVAWQSVDSLPMVRRLLTAISQRSFYPGFYGYVGDSGRFGLTVGDGKVFTVYDFLPVSTRHNFSRRPGAGAAGLDDGSRLAALSVQDQGKLLWWIGRGQGDHEIVRNGKFLSPPTYHAGRLYVVALYLERYHLLCLDADSAALIWQSPVAQVPAVPRRYYVGMDPRLSVGSPPAVADGRVFVATNAGVVAAFEQETGQPLWGYQYDSATNTAGVLPRAVYSGRYRVAVFRPGNPIVLSRQRVICLPADAASLLALDAANGTLRWEKDRRGQQDLSAVDADRVLLSGTGLFVLKVADGQCLHASADQGIQGRPAVTGKIVLASALGKVKALDLKTYHLTSMGLAKADGYLGNLVSADGKLLAANMLGVCAYFSYDVARADLSKLLGRVAPERRPRLLLDRAQLAFDARRFAEALADLEACEKLTRGKPLEPGISHLPSLLYRTYVALGNRAEQPKRMQEMFLNALSQARTDQQRAHMKLRLARYHEKIGEIARAAELAQEIADEYGEEGLVEVEIGPGADDSVRFGAARQTIPGAKLAQDFIQGLIEAHGRDCYARYDALAGEALKAARSAGDLEAILAVADRWPNSRWADDALFAAAEAYYARARAEPAKKEDHLAQARRHLYRVTQVADSPLRVSAGVALATIYARGGWITSAQNQCDRLRKLPGETDVAFADVKGKLADVLEAIEGGKLPAAPKARGAGAAWVQPPLEKIFTVEGRLVGILRDQEGRPVRLGERIAIVKDGEAYLMDTSARDANAALAGWKGLVQLDVEDLEKRAYYPPGMRWLGGLSRDGKVLIAADRKLACGVDVASAKVLWRQEWTKVQLSSFLCGGVGDGMLVAADSGGLVTCLDAATGKLLWQNRLVSRSRAPAGPPHIGGGMAIFRHDGGKAVTCLSLDKGGRVIGKWQSLRWSQCMLTGDGRLLMMLDGELTVRESAQIAKPLWTRKFDAGRYPVILGTSGDMLAVSPANTDGPVEVLSIPGGGRTVATLQTAPVIGLPAVPFDALFQRQGLYVLCSAGTAGRRKYTYGRRSNSRGLSLQKFDIALEKRLWSRDVESPAQYYPNVPPLTRGRGHVVVTARQYQVQVAHHAHVVDGEAGTVAQKVPLHGRAAGQNENRRRQSLGPVVLTDGRLCVETSEGVQVYGKR